ncbi:hypothetical protein IWQ61_000589 [Dispira simplex]|nr:hypothetical protein IWQ61_000589 [Dispira simplex]
MTPPFYSSKTPFCFYPPSVLRRSVSDNELGSVPENHPMVNAQSARSTSWAGQPEAAPVLGPNDGEAVINRLSEAPHIIFSLGSMSQETCSPTCTVSLSNTSANLNSFCTKNPHSPAGWTLQQMPPTTPRPVSSLHTTQQMVEKKSPKLLRGAILSVISAGFKTQQPDLRKVPSAGPDMPRLSWVRERHPAFWVSICLVASIVIVTFVACHITTQDYVCQRGIGHQVSLCQALITLQCEPLLPCSNGGVAYLTVHKGNCACHCPKGFLGKLC